MEGKKIKQKKWIIALAVLVAVAIAVTLVIVLLPKNTTNAVHQLDTQAKVMYLKKEGTDKNYQDLKGRIKGVAALDEEIGQEVEDVYTLCQDLNFTIEFYNSWLIYAQDNEVFQGEYNNILRQLSIASSKQDSMEKIVEEALAKFGPLDSGFFRGVWNDFKESFVGYFEANTSLIKSLNKVYQACIPESVIANKLTCLTLNTVDDYLAVIQEDFSKSSVKIAYLKVFLDYFNTSLKTVLVDYNFNTSLQTKYKQLTSFGEIYKDKTIKDLIKSMISGVNFDFEKAEDDDDNVLDLCKNYLLGRLEA